MGGPIIIIQARCGAWNAVCVDGNLHMCICACLGYNDLVDDFVQSNKHTTLKQQYIQAVSKKETEIKMLIYGELHVGLLKFLRNGNHHITSWCLLSINNKKLMLLSQMTEHEYFEGTLSEMALR